VDTRNLVALSLLGLLIAAPANAQSTVTPPSAPTTFPESFFAPYTPVTAFDMVNRVPGFSFRDGGGARGFGVNAGNVVINGARPTIKSETLESVLIIPATSVARIEIIDQALAGLGRLANVVLKSSAKTSGTFVLGASAGEQGDFAGAVQGAVTYSGSNRQITLSLSRRPTISRITGPELVLGRGGDLRERRQFDTLSENAPTSLSASLSQSIGKTKLNVRTKATWPFQRTQREGGLF
jgi:outer membrane receptor for ferrienterochelin and colicins